VRVNTSLDHDQRVPDEPQEAAVMMTLRTLLVLTGMIVVAASFTGARPRAFQ
jgi:hypothetical protein